MEKISFEAYYYEPNGAQKDKWKQKVQATLFSSSKGYKISYYDSDCNIDKIMDGFYKGYRAELKVRDHLNKMNPDRTFVFKDPEAAGCFLVGKIPDNDYDLTNELGESVEVKGYTIYRGKDVYFKTRLSTPDRFWNEVIHGADALIVYDEVSKLGGILRKENFMTSYTTQQNNQNPKATTWILTLTEVKEI